MTKRLLSILLALLLIVINIVPAFASFKEGYPYKRLLTVTVTGTNSEGATVTYGVTLYFSSMYPDSSLYHLKYTNTKTSTWSEQSGAYLTDLQKKYIDTLYLSVSSNGDVRLRVKNIAENLSYVGSAIAVFNLANATGTSATLTSVDGNAFLDKANGKMYIMQDGQLVEAPGFHWFGNGVYVYNGNITLVNPNDSTVSTVMSLADYCKAYQAYYGIVSGIAMSAFPPSTPAILFLNAAFNLASSDINGLTTAFVNSPYGKFLFNLADAVTDVSPIAKAQYYAGYLYFSQFKNTQADPVSLPTMPLHGGATRKFTINEYKALVEPIQQVAAAQDPPVDTSIYTDIVDSWETVAPGDSLPFTYIINTTTNNNYTNSHIPAAAYIPPVIADDLYSKGKISTPSVGTPSTSTHYPFSFSTVPLDPNFCSACILAGCPCYETGSCTDGICTNGHCYGCTCSECVNAPCDETNPTPPPDSSGSGSDSGSSSSGSGDGGGSTGTGLDAILKAIAKLFNAVNNIILQLGAGIITLATTLIDTLAGLTSIGGAFKDFLTAAVPFIPPEIISLLCLAVTLAIVGMVIKFFK